jgi:HAD superfamily hydrolase (TIGR01509 family)
LSAAELASYGERKQQLFSLAAAEIRAFPGVVELLRELQDAGIPRAVVTSASRSRAHALLAYTGLAPYFSIVVAAEDVAQGKPDPAAFRRAAELLNVPSQSCLVAEDSWAGVQGATMAGMNCLAIADGARAVRLLNAGAISAVPGFAGLTIRNLQDLFQRSGVDATFPVGNSEISCRRVAEEV